MAGNKNSGRKSRGRIAREGNLLDLCTNWLIENFHTFDNTTKVRVAMTIAQKGIVQKVEANVNYSAKTILESVEQASTKNRVYEKMFESVPYK